jgi:acetyl esterase/lipase
MMFRAMLVLATIGAILAPLSPATAEEISRRDYDVTVSHDIIYGHAPVAASSGSVKQRDLLLDVYRPVMDGKPLTGRPAIVMAFGGAFHRGDRRNFIFTSEGAQDSSMAEYCRTFARAGYACFSIDYRLIQEDPGLVRPLDEKRIVPRAINLSSEKIEPIANVRRLMGMPPFDDTTLTQYWHTTFAAADDMAMATAFVRAHAGEFGIDGERLALGCFSAGAITTLNTAYGLGVPAKAVVSLSGGISGYDLDKTAENGMPPALLVLGQNDYLGVHNGTRHAATALGSKGIATEIAWVPGFGHFYPMGSVSLGGKVSRSPVSVRVMDFLDTHLGVKRGQ